MYRTLCLFVILLLSGTPALPAQKTFGVIEYNKSISEFNVTKGEDLLYDAIQRGATLRFRNRTFSFLGQQFK